jgi:hypothetical protein
MNEKKREQDALRAKKYRAKKHMAKYNDDKDHRRVYCIGQVHSDWLIVDENRDDLNNKLYKLECCLCGTHIFRHTGKMSRLSPCRCNSYRDIASRITPKTNNIKHYLDKIRHGVIKRKLSFDLTVNDLLQLFIDQNNICPYTGFEICYQDGTASLDRINPEIGYERGNVQWIYKPVNFMKHSMSEFEFLNLCTVIHKNIEHKRASSQD